MLILRRRAGESIIIAGHIRVEVAEIAGNQVKLVIDAPKEVPVYREEVWEEIRREMMEAASPSGVPAGENAGPLVSAPGETAEGGLEVTGEETEAGDTDAGDAGTGDTDAGDTDTGDTEADQG